MKNKSVVIAAVLYGVVAGALAHAQAPAAAPTKIAIVNLGAALQNTKEGQKAAAEMNNKYGPKKAEADKRQSDIDALTDRLNKGRATLSEDAQKQLTNEITGKTTSLKRFIEDSQADMDADEGKIGQDLQTKMFPLMQAYAIQGNFAVVLDVGSQSTPVLWYATATDITNALIQQYDQAHPVADTGAAKAPAAKPPAAAPAKPPAAPATAPAKTPASPAAPPKKQ